MKKVIGLLSLVFITGIIAVTAPVGHAATKLPLAIMVNPDAKAPTAHNSAAYMHAEYCYQGLRYGAAGDRDRDDDIHNEGVRIGAVSATPMLASAHYDDTRTLVVIHFYLANGNWVGENGYCHGSDSNFNDQMNAFPTGWGW